MKKSIENDLRFYDKAISSVDENSEGVFDPLHSGAMNHDQNSICVERVSVENSLFFHINSRRVKEEELVECEKTLALALLTNHLIKRIKSESVLHFPKR